MKNILSGIILICLLSGCASSGVKVTLLPEENGKVGTISLIDNKGMEHIINKPYTALEISDNGAIKDSIENEKEISLRYKTLMEVLPKKLQNYYFFFSSGSADLTSEQKKEIQDVAKTIASNTIHQVICIGHSDSTGTPEGNEKVSSDRAKNVANELIANGIKSEIITLEYYGDANPLVKTKQNVANEKNRRVEIILK